MWNKNRWFCYASTLQLAYECLWVVFVLVPFAYGEHALRPNVEHDSTLSRIHATTDAAIFEIKRNAVYRLSLFYTYTHTHTRIRKRTKTLFAMDKIDRATQDIY